MLARGETIETALGTFDGVVRTRDTTALEPDALEHKLYAPGFGLIGELAFDVVTGEEDAIVRLVSATRDGQPVTQVVPPDHFNARTRPARGAAACASWAICPSPARRRTSCPFSSPPHSGERRS